MHRRILELFEKLRNKRQYRQELWDLSQELRRQRQAANAGESEQLWKEQNYLWQEIRSIGWELSLLADQLILRQRQWLDLKHSRSDDPESGDTYKRSHGPKK